MRKIKSCKSLICCHCSCTQGSNPGNVPWHRWPEETAQAPITALGMKLRDGALPCLCRHHNTEPTGVARWWSMSGVGQDGFTQQWSSVCIQDFIRPLWCVVFAVSLLPISLLRNMLAFLSSSTVQTSWEYVRVWVFQCGMWLSEWDVDVIIRVGDRECSLGFQCFMLSGFYQAKRKPKELMFHFPWLRSCWFRGKEGRCWKVFRRGLEAGQATDG